LVQNFSQLATTEEELMCGMILAALIKHVI